MTIYEQIQRALDLMESWEGSGGKKRDAAKEAGMSLRSFSHWFWAVSGMTYREYAVRRKLSRSLEVLAQNRKTILEAALEAGYTSHEAYTRAFRAEYHITPREYRRSRPELVSLGKLNLYKELFMGIVIKDLKQMNTVVFSAWGESPEDKAHGLMNQWMSAHKGLQKPARVFGHNIDKDGHMTGGEGYAGYRLYRTLVSGETPDSAPGEIISAGRFAVTGIEGNFQEDPQGKWIQKGWSRMTAMIQEKGYKVKEGGRWFEEELEPVKPGNLRLDLYLELEG